ncbi:hypothetical protein EUGRSUZ_L01348 [Eucalyptus grandis]|uniref:Uncharacterized protein n=1 Tax=Eucalyptus grandis TaxID=71139 RepID=A0A058ZTE1_EUCGR|nr:hypothetical protein EUGRSUZ_L01348 [Eucalyptus grandis]
MQQNQTTIEISANCIPSRCSDGCHGFAEEEDDLPLHLCCLTMPSFVLSMGVQQFGPQICSADLMIFSSRGISQQCCTRLFPFNLFHCHWLPVPLSIGDICGPHVTTETTN